MNPLEPPTQEASKLVFGNSYMAAVMIEISAVDTETFSPKQIVAHTGLYFSVVNPLIHKLRDAGFIELVGRAPGERTLLYRVVENPWWDAARRYAHSGATAGSSSS
jgi:hypothetical protein